MVKLENVYAVCFDLDGTLADPFDDLYEAVSGMLRGLSLPDEDPHAIKDWIGDGADLLIHRVLTRHIDGRVSTSVLNQARALFLSSYLGNKPPKTRLYPGVLACLETLSQRRIPMVCTTDMQTAHANSLLRALGVGHFFTRILGTDAISAGKPDPDGIYEAAAILGISPFELLVVGDSVSDIHAARAAGAPVICVNYGYNYGTGIQKACPDTTLDTLASLPNIIARPNSMGMPGQGVTTPPVLAGSLRGRAMRPKGGAQFR